MQSKPHCVVACEGESDAEIAALPGPARRTQVTASHPRHRQRDGGSPTTVEPSARRRRVRDIAPQRTVRYTTLWSF